MRQLIGKKYPTQRRVIDRHLTMSNDVNPLQATSNAGWRWLASGCELHRCYHPAKMDPKLWSSFVWAFSLIVLLGLTAMAIAFVRRRIGPGADESTPSPGGSFDWISLLNSLQDGRIEPKRWTALAPLLVAQANACPPALRAPIIAALDLAISHGRDPLARMSMNQIRTALAALPGA